MAVNGVTEAGSFDVFVDEFCLRSPRKHAYAFSCSAKFIQSVMAISRFDEL